MSILKKIILEEINNSNLADSEYVYINSEGNLINIPKEYLFKIREINNIDKNTEILHARYFQHYNPGDFWQAARTGIWSTIFLEDRICIRQIVETTGWDKNPDYVNDILWDEIEEVEIVFAEVKDDNGKTEKEFYLRIFSKNNNEFIDIPVINFVLDDEQESLDFAVLINNIVQRLDNVINEHSNNLEGTVEEIREKVNGGEFAEALEIIRSNFILDEVRHTDIVLYYFLVFHTASSLKGLGQNKESLKHLNERIIVGDDSDGFKEWGQDIYHLKAELNESLENYYTSMQDYYTSYNNEQNVETRSLIKDKLTATYSKFKETFSSLNYDERKTILVYDEIKASPSNTFIVLDKTNLPDKLKFPFSHPKKEEIYIGHPYISENYLPFSTYEASLFNDRFEEFSYFIQCLGAKSMTIKVIKGNEKITTDNETSNLNGSVGLGKSVIKNTANGSFENDRNSNKQEDLLTSRTRTQIYSPVKKPYIPENLLWFPHETSWYRLYQQRINGNILHHHDVMSSKSSHSISKNEKSNLKVALKNFFAEINVDRDTFIETTLNETETIEWEISVEFESIDNLTEIHQDNTQIPIKNLPINIEQQYVEEIQFMLEDDGVIDEKERRILNRLSEKLGISKEQASRIENELLSSGNLNDNEKEYIEEFKEMLNDGEITEKERRILNRFADRLEISSERIAQLEMLVNK